jgi:ABC-type multidrug transport system fused ATPase/permease subunit
MWGFHDDDDQITEEEPSKGRRDYRLIRNLLPYFRPYWPRVIAAGFLLLLSTLLTIAGPLLIKRVIDYELPQKNLAGLVYLSIIYFLLQVVIILVRYYQQVSIQTVGERAIADLKNDVFRHMITLPVTYFDQHPVGRLITRVESDNENLKSLFSSTSVVIAQDFVLLLGMSLVMISINVRLYLLIFIILPAFLLGFWWFGRKVRPVYIEVRRKIAEINSIVVEAVRGLSVIQVFGLEPRFEERVRNLGQTRFRLEMKAQSYWYRIWMLVDMGEVIGIILVLGVGGAWALRGLVTIGALFLFISYITRLFGPLRGLSDQINLIERAFASAERVFGILRQEPEADARETDVLAGFERELAFRGVNFSYQEEKWILNDINFRIKKGERIALVGETGGGKTSIVSLLLKFYEPQKGDILVDGIPMVRIRRDSLRRKIGFVPQDVILFPGTVLDNLRLFNRGIPAERVHEAARRARIHDRIQALPKAYETDIIEQGVNLSFGERQLISFARALVFDPELVILDEATSSVDPESERLVQEGMKELLKDRTAIIIAHRLTTTRLADRIIVIHNGRLVEEGRHQDLIRRKGYYQRLYQLQYLSAIP